MKIAPLAILTITLMSAAAAPAYAVSINSFVISSEDGDESKFFIIDANKDVSSFAGHVGSNNSGPIVNVQTIGNVDTGNGYANIKPIKDGTLTSLLFTPADATLFDGMFFRGQIAAAGKPAFDGMVFLDIVNQLNILQTLTFTGVPTTSDFATLGFEPSSESSPFGTIKSVKLYLDSTGVFNEVKQIDFSSESISPVPLPAALPLLASGLGGFGLMGWWRKRRRSQAAHA